jgi:glucose-1-phosphate cytidylyltransferase
MKAVILAGGLGSRLAEETVLRPKPMVEIGGRPILWHIMMICAEHGIDEFIIALGYKGEMIKQYFLTFNEMNADLSIDLGAQSVTFHDGDRPNWKVHLVDTGANTQTAGRLKRLKPWLDSEEEFLFTYGDGVGDIDITALIDFHRDQGRMATVTSVRSPARFGRLSFEGDRVVEFFEKPETGEGWINGGFFVLTPAVFDCIEGDESIFERECVEQLARRGQLAGYRHYGFFSCMDTIKERQILEEIWATGKAPWKIWP